MSKILTAEEFYKSVVGATPSEIDQHNCTIEVIVEFAKIKVKEALEAAANKADLTMETYFSMQEGSSTEIDKESILNSYDLNSIQ